MVQQLARMGVLIEAHDVSVWRDWLLDGLFKQVASLRGTLSQVRGPSAVCCDNVVVCWDCLWLWRQLLLGALQALIAAALLLAGKREEGCTQQQKQ